MNFSDEDIEHYERILPLRLRRLPESSCYEEKLNALNKRDGRQKLFLGVHVVAIVSIVFFLTHGITPMSETTTYIFLGLMSLNSLLFFSQIREAQGLRRYLEWKANG